MANIVITGLHYPITAALEYITRAFKREGHNVLTAGPYNGLYMPWENGMLVSKAYDFVPDIVLPGGDEIPFKFLENKLPKDFYPDLWLDVNAGCWLGAGRPKNGVRATYLTDPHVLPGVYSPICADGRYQAIFNSQKNYMLRDIPNQHFVPYAADKEWHAPIADVEKVYDVALIGNVYSDRVRLFEHLKNQLKFKCHFGLGLAKLDAKLIYNTSKVGVNWSSANDITARVFELAAMGSPVPVYNYVPGLEEFFNNDSECLIFDGSHFGHSYSIINHGVIKYEELKHLGQNARKLVVEKGHFWDNRVQQMLDILNIK